MVGVPGADPVSDENSRAAADASSVGMFNGGAPGGLPTVASGPLRGGGDFMGWEVVLLGDNNIILADLQEVLQGPPGGRVGSADSKAVLAYTVGIAPGASLDGLPSLTVDPSNVRFRWSDEGVEV